MSSSVSPARQVAFDLLLELREMPQSHSDELLRSRPAEALSPVDRNLLTTLVMGVLRWKIALDARIAAALTGPKDRLSPTVEMALELGALQLLLLDRIPAHAAVFESVELTKQSGNVRAAGLVNAVLRKLIHAPKLTPADKPLASVEEIARVWAHPVWMVKRWAEVHGIASTGEICRFDQFPPAPSLRLVDPGAEAALQEEGVELAAGSFVERARRVISGDVTAGNAFAQGLVRLQDEGSQLIAELAAGGIFSTDSASATILDCCAAPGGKTAILAERHPQIPILACDIHPGRLKAMQAYLRRQKGRIEFLALDTGKMRLDRLFDRVLCDVPCSGTGTLARNPEIRHRLTVEGVLRHQERQVRILSSAMNALAPGGQLVYATCSLEREENEDVVNRALANREDFRLVSCKERIEELEAAGVLRAGSVASLFAPGSSGQFLQTLPGVHACDGFFGAAITRES